MPEKKETAKPSSRYALKVRGEIPVQLEPKGIRFCMESGCHRRLPGKKGHGFVTKDGKKVTCGPCSVKPHNAVGRR